MDFTISLPPVYLIPPVGTGLETSLRCVCVLPQPQVWLIMSCALFKSGEFSSAQEALVELQAVSRRKFPSSFPINQLRGRQSLLGAGGVCLLQRIHRCGLPSNHSLAVHCKELETKVHEQLRRMEDKCAPEESNSDSAPSGDDSESREMAVEGQL